MSNAPTILWTGKSGKQYQYWIYPIGATFQEAAGNYIFAAESRPGQWTPAYIGQTENLNRRLGAIPFKLP